MANEYYDGTGVLVLDQVTPIVTALFGGFALDANYPGNGQACIAESSRSIRANWETIREALATRASTLGLTPVDVEPVDDDKQRAQIVALARHLNCDDPEVVAELMDKAGAVELEDLLGYAQHLNDGHGLKEIRWEACWHCSQPQLFKFGGNGVYLSAAVALYRSSSTVAALGANLNQRLTEGNLDKAADICLADVGNLLTSIKDEATRKAVRQRLAAQLAALP